MNVSDLIRGNKLLKKKFRLKMGHLILELFVAFCIMHLFALFAGICFPSL